MKNASVIPRNIKPMLATLVNGPFDDSEWVYEVKWDGYRALAYLYDHEVEIQSRNQKSFNEKFYPVYRALQQLKINAVFDGEIVALNKKGLSDFSALQSWRSEADGDLAYYIFDILWLDGSNLMGSPLTERQDILKEILADTDDRIRMSKVFKASGTDFFDAAVKMGLEGIVAKKADSTYTPDLRSREWLKIKVHKRQEVIIGGYTKNENSTKQFSSLLLGVYQNDTLRYAGKVGTGFSDQKQKELIALFKPLIIPQSPFLVEPDVNKPSRFRPNPPHAEAVWLKPELVCEVSYAEVTGDSVFRHPSFEGMREDKRAADIILEKEKSTDDVLTGEDDLLTSRGIIPPKASERKTLLNPGDDSQVRKVKGHEIKFAHLNKLYWPDEGYTKRDMLNYYYQVAPFILPYLKDRPQSLNRFPNGIKGSSFYQKNVKDKAPDWIKTFPYTTSENEHKEFMVGSDEASLLYMATLGAIEMNPWFSRVQSPDHPDYCVIDLDPDKNTFDQVIDAALTVKQVLDTIGVPSYCKTSGSTGMHIYIPLAAKYNYDQSQLFGRLIANIVHQQIPDYTSVERMIANRHGKMYIDFLQNRPGATLACPYSLRPKAGATVSIPLHWNEVKHGLTMKHFTIKNSIERVRSEGDLFKGVLGKGINLEKVIKKAKSLFEITHEKTDYI